MATALSTTPSVLFSSNDKEQSDTPSVKATTWVLLVQTTFLYDKLLSVRAQHEKEHQERTKGRSPSCSSNSPPSS